MLLNLHAMTCISCMVNMITAITLILQYLLEMNFDSFLLLLEFSEWIERTFSE